MNKCKKYGQVRNPLDGNSFSKEIREQTLHNVYSPKDDTLDEQKVENKTTDWQRFSVICDKILIAKLRLIAKKEHFTIREVLEYWMRTGIEKYESEYGEISEDSHIRVITDVFK
jgi:uncharacterized protein YydD (DUF2326 family)